MPGGRPTKYDESYCEKLIEHMSQGFSYESFAGLIRVSKQTLYTWEKANPEFMDAKSIGVELSRLWWEQAGKEGMFTEYQGTSMNASVWVFNMKNRFGWRDKQPGEDTTIQVQVPSQEPMTDERMIKFIKAARGEG